MVHEVDYHRGFFQKLFGSITAIANFENGQLKKLDAAIPVGRMARPEEIASVVGFLAGPGASYMTSTTVFADGGIMQGSVGL